MKELYYNKQGKVITREKWAKLMEDFEFKVVEQSILSNGLYVSTVWLGLNHQFGKGDPLIFETMVFPNKGTWLEQDCVRYSTLKEAQAGHKELVKKYENS